MSLEDDRGSATAGRNFGGGGKLGLVLSMEDALVPKRGGDNVADLNPPAPDAETVRRTDELGTVETGAETVDHSSSGTAEDADEGEQVDSPACVIEDDEAVKGLFAFRSQGLSYERCEGAGPTKLPEAPVEGELKAERRGEGDLGLPSGGGPFDRGRFCCHGRPDVELAKPVARALPGTVSEFGPLRLRGGSLRLGGLRHAAVCLTCACAAAAAASISARLS